jgi:hypothetical protein
MIREEEGTRVIRETPYTDWHRVERAVATLERSHAVVRTVGLTPTAD